MILIIKKLIEKYFQIKTRFIYCSWIFPNFQKKLLSIPKIGSINLHAGKLPKYRGGSPLNWQLINREKKLVFQ